MDAVTKVNDKVLSESEQFEGSNLNFNQGLLESVQIVTRVQDIAGRGQGVQRPRTWSGRAAQNQP